MRNLKILTLLVVFVVCRLAYAGVNQNTPPTEQQVHKLAAAAWQERPHSIDVALHLEVTWPDGTNDTYGPKTLDWDVNYSNQCIEASSPGLDDIGRIDDGSGYVNFEYVINVPEEYKNSNSVWVNWYSNEDHDHEYRGSDQKARSEVHGDNTANGGWQGPWQ